MAKKVAAKVQTKLGSQLIKLHEEKTQERLQDLLTAGHKLTLDDLGKLSNKWKH